MSTLTVNPQISPWRRLAFKHIFVRPATVTWASCRISDKQALPSRLLKSSWSVNSHLTLVILAPSNSHGSLHCTASWHTTNSPSLSCVSAFPWYPSAPNFHPAATAAVVTAAGVAGRRTRKGNNLPGCTIRGLLSLLYHFGGCARLQQNCFLFPVES